MNHRESESAGARSGQNGLPTGQRLVSIAKQDLSRLYLPPANEIVRELRKLGKVGLQIGREVVTSPGQLTTQRADLIRSILIVADDSELYRQALERHNFDDLGWRPNELATVVSRVSKWRQYDDPNLPRPVRTDLLFAIGATEIPGCGTVSVSAISQLTKYLRRESSLEVLSHLLKVGCSEDARRSCLAHLLSLGEVGAQSIVQLLRTAPNASKAEMLSSLDDVIAREVVGSKVHRSAYDLLSSLCLAPDEFSAQCALRSVQRWFPKETPGLLGRVLESEQFDSVRVAAIRACMHLGASGKEALTKIRDPENDAARLDVIASERHIIFVGSPQARIEAQNNLKTLGIVEPLLHGQELYASLRRMVHFSPVNDAADAVAALALYHGPAGEDTLDAVVAEFLFGASDLSQYDSFGIAVELIRAEVEGIEPEARKAALHSASVIEEYINGPFAQSKVAVPREFEEKVTEACIALDSLFNRGRRVGEIISFCSSSGPHILPGIFRHLEDPPSGYLNADIYRMVAVTKTLAGLSILANLGEQNNSPEAYRAIVQMVVDKEQSLDVRGAAIAALWARPPGIKAAIEAMGGSRPLDLTPALTPAQVVKVLEATPDFPDPAVALRALRLLRDKGLLNYPYLKSELPEAGWEVPKYFAQQFVRLSDPLFSMEIKNPRVEPAVLLAIVCNEGAGWDDEGSRGMVAWNAFKRVLDDSEVDIYHRLQALGALLDRGPRALLEPVTRKVVALGALPLVIQIRFESRTPGRGREITEILNGMTSDMNVSYFIANGCLDENTPANRAAAMRMCNALNPANMMGGIRPVSRHILGALFPTTYGSITGEATT